MPEIKILNKKVFYREWKAKKESSRAIFLHGFGSHSEYFEKAGKLLAGSGITCYAPDLIGFGKSGGERGHIRSFNTYLRMIGKFSREAVKKDFFLMGESLGALLAIMYAMKADDPKLKGVLSLAAPFELKNKRKVQQAISKALKDVAPKLKVNIRLKNTTSDKDREKKMKKDPLRIDKMSLKFGDELMRSIRFIKENPEKLTVPIFLLQGKLDRSVVPSSAARFYFLLDCSKKLKVYPDSMHDLLGCADADQVMKDMAGWINDEERASAKAK